MIEEVGAVAAASSRESVQETCTAYRAPSAAQPSSTDAAQAPSSLPTVGEAPSSACATIEDTYEPSEAAEESDDFVIYSPKSRFGVSGEKGEAYPSAPVKAFDVDAELSKLDRNGDGDVTKNDLMIDGEAFGKRDTNGDGRLSKDEFRADFSRQNSFENLDQDHDGDLSTDEMANLQRFGSGRYDRDNDGSVDAKEFVAGRSAEMKAARREALDERLATLDDSALAKKLAKYDANKDGSLTASEVLAGRREKRQELHPGQEADLRRQRIDRYLKGTTVSASRDRVGSDAAGRARPGEAADVGKIKDLTWQRAVDIIKSQGGKPFQNGEATVLAIRTENKGTQTYDDVFVVVKPNGDMKTFAGTTRPGFTTPSGGWDPGMVVPGNYKLAPRPADGKWSDAFYIEKADGNMAVPTAKDRNGDGRYSEKEIANTVADDLIRLHPGNATTTSSAGCFNVQDYNSFLKFVGGHDASYHMTLVEA